MVSLHAWVIPLAAVPSALWVFPPPDIRPPGRTTWVVIFTTLAVLSLVLVFGETELESTAGRRFTRPIVAVHWLGSSLVLFHGIVNAPHANDGCRLVYALHAVCHVSFWAVACLHWGRGHFSWVVGRICLVADGALFLCSTLLLALLGQADVFPPGSVPFSSACCRGLSTLVMGLALTATNRRRIRRFLPSVGHILGVSAHRMECLLCSMVEALEDDWDMHAVAESANVACLRAGTPPELSQWGMSMAKRELAKRYSRQRSVLALTPVVWYALATGLKHHQGHGVMLLLLPLMCGAALFLAAMAPVELGSRAGRKFTLPLVTAIAVLALFVDGQDYFIHGVAMHVNDACRRVHATVVVLVSLNWWTNALLCYAGRHSWTVIRIVLLNDGIFLGLGALAMRQLGPPPFYHPRHVALPEAMLRAATSPIIALLLTMSNRRRIAEYVNSLGWHHVTMGLATAGSLSELGVQRAGSEPRMLPGGSTVASGYSGSSKSRA